jgi:hypothetical protein
MSCVHYYLGRPVYVWIAANARCSPARRAHKDSGERRRQDLVPAGDEVLPSACGWPRQSMIAMATSQAHQLT